MKGSTHYSTDIRTFPPIYKIFIYLFLAVLALHCGTWTLMPRGMWDLSSPARDQTCVSWIGRQILNHWTTREVPYSFFNQSIRNFFGFWFRHSLSTVREEWGNGIINSVDMSLSKVWEIAKDREVMKSTLTSTLACCSPWGCKDSDTLSDWTTTNKYPNNIDEETLLKEIAKSFMYLSYWYDYLSFPWFSFKCANERTYDLCF